MHYIVYKTINLVNNKEYIGIHQTRDLNDGYLGSGIHLKRAITKYGPENFKREILFIYDNEQDMLAKEADIVTEEWCSWSNTYNICVGGFGGGWKYANSIVWTKEKRRAHNARVSPFRTFTVEQRSEYSRLSGLSQKGKPKKKPTWTGKQHSDATKTRMSTSHQGIHDGPMNHQFGTMWITNGTENRKVKTLDNLPDGWYRGRKILRT